MRERVLGKGSRTTSRPTFTPSIDATIEAAGPTAATTKAFIDVGSPFLPRWSQTNCAIVSAIVLSVSPMITTPSRLSASR